MSSSVSIKEIAELAGVSIATVSRVVNQKGGYSAATEERVRSIIQKTCYAQGAIARGAQNEKKAVIGLMVPDILNEHFTEEVFGDDDPTAGQRTDSCIRSRRESGYQRNPDRLRGSASGRGSE